MDDVVRQALETQHGLRLGRRLGRGGFAEVYAAETAEAGIPCAIKVSLDRVDGNNPAVQKELDNLRLLRNLTGHPHVVSLIDLWLIDQYLVTRWELASASLLDVLAYYQQQGQPGIPPQELSRYIWEAAKGIDFLNGQGVYHRDIKPANLLVFQGHVKLGDLGLAKLAGASTVSHTGAGTLGYLPLEAYGEHRLTATVDVYSLAATYVKLRTGREPFGQTPVEVVERQKAGRPKLEGLTAAEAEAVRQALAPRPEDRPQQGACAWVKHLYRVGSGARPAAFAVLRPKEPILQLGHTDTVSSAEYSPDGRRIVSASGDKTVRVWDAATGTLTLMLQGHTRGVLSASYSPDGRRKEPAAMLKAIHGQEDRQAAREKAEAIARKLESMKLSQAAAIVRDGVEETLSYMALPREHWTRIRTNNMLERIMREIRRRTRAVGNFPDGRSAVMLVAARLRYVAGTRWGTRQYMDMERLREEEQEEPTAKVG